MIRFSIQNMHESNPGLVFLLPYTSNANNDDAIAHTGHRWVIPPVVAN